MMRFPDKFPESPRHTQTSDITFTSSDSLIVYSQCLTNVTTQIPDQAVSCHTEERCVCSAVSVGVCVFGVSYVVCVIVCVSVCLSVCLSMYLCECHALMLSCVCVCVCVSLCISVSVCMQCPRVC